MLLHLKLPPEARRWILFSFSFASVSLVAGLVYGWPALRQELLSDGSTLTEKQLGAVFTVGAWSTQGNRFLTGLARDRYGTRIAACLCFTCAAAGSLGIALSDASNGAAVGASLFLLGVGSGTQLCVQPVAGLFPKHAGAVLSTLSGAFQISGLVFLILTNVSSSRKGNFLGFCFFILGLTVIAALLLPTGGSFVLEEEEKTVLLEVNQNKDITQESPADVEESDAEDPNASDVMISNTNEESDDNDSEPKHESTNLSHNGDENSSSMNEVSDDNDSEPKYESTNLSCDGDANIEDANATNNNEEEHEETHPTALQQLRSKEYLGLLIWFSVCIVPLQYYVGTIGFQLEEKGDDGFYTSLFSITYASAAIVAPAGGYLADKFSLGIAHGLATTLTAASLFILASPASLNVQVVGLVCYGVGRMLTFGNYFSNVGKRFGYANYGTLAGLGLITSAIISLLQYPLIAWAADGHEVPVNVACGAMLMAVLPYCFWLHRQEQRSGKAPFFKQNFLTGNTG